jgi:hypothetical protein
MSRWSRIGILSIKLPSSMTSMTAFSAHHKLRSLLMDRWCDRWNFTSGITLRIDQADGRSPAREGDMGTVARQRLVAPSECEISQCGARCCCLLCSLLDVRNYSLSISFMALRASDGRFLTSAESQNKNFFPLGARRSWKKCQKKSFSASLVSLSALLFCVF